MLCKGNPETSKEEIEMTHTQELTQVEPCIHAGYMPVIIEDKGPSLKTLIAAWIADAESKRTRETYRHSLKSFIEYMGTGSLESAIFALMQNPGHANLVVQSFREWLRSHEYSKGGKVRTYSPATTNLKLAALRSLLDFIDVNGTGLKLNIKVKGVKSRTLRDVRGPSETDVEKILAVIASRGDTSRDKRNRAMFYLLLLNALRRQEIVAMSIEDFHGSWIEITGKGMAEGEKIPISIPTATRRAITDWIECRGNHPGSLFEISPTGFYKVIGRLSRDAGIDRDVTVHAMRHHSITKAAESNDLISLQKFARHGSPVTTQLYIDASRDYAGDISNQLAEVFNLQ